MSDGNGHPFLGEEFLTWLWFRTETEGGEFDLGGGRVVGISFDDFIAFAPREDDETEQTLRKGLPTRSDEGRTALQNGHRLAKAKLILAMSDLQWSFTFMGATMQLSSIKLPDDSEDAESQEERSRERAAHFLLVQELMFSVYRQFLELRLDADYLKGPGERQAAWMASG